MKIDFRRIFLVAGITAQLIIYPLLWLRMITNPVERTGSDFIAFYTAGRITRLDGPGQVYDIDRQQQVQAEQVGFELIPGQVLLYNHIPWLIPLLWLIAGPNYVYSFIAWQLLLLGILVLSILLLVRMLPGGWKGENSLPLLLGGVTFFPLFASLMNGQDTAFACLGAVLLASGVLNRRDYLGGLGLALITVRPHIALLLAIPFLFHHRKVLIWAIIFGAGLAGLSLLLIGWDGARNYLDLVLISAAGEWYGLKEAAMVNLIGLLHRFAPGLGVETIRLTGWIVYASALLGLSIVWKFSREIRETQLTLAVILGMFAVPHLHYHDLTLLLIPLWLLLNLLVRGGYLPLRDAILIPVGASLLLLLGSLIPGAQYSLPALVMIVLILATWFPEKVFRKSTVKEKY